MRTQYEASLGSTGRIQNIWDGFLELCTGNVNVSPRIALHGEVPNVDDISTEAFAGPFRPAVESLRQHLSNILPVLSTLFLIAEPRPPLTDRTAHNPVNLNVYSRFEYTVHHPADYQAALACSQAEGAANSFGLLCWGLFFHYRWDSELKVGFSSLLSGYPSSAPLSHHIHPMQRAQKQLFCTS